jgi:uncharacterized membrane protein YhhN
MPGISLFAGAALLALLYLICQRYRPYSGSFALKAAPILLLALAAGRYAPSPERLWLVSALFLSAAGDIALDFYRGRSERFFLVGLGFFWLAHLVYIGGLTRSLDLSGAPWALLPLTALAIGLLTYYLWPHLGRLRWPVLLYIAIISGMAASASLHTPTNVHLIAGAFTFMLSDALIAIDKFLARLPARDLSIMLTYYLAQFLITLAFTTS